MTFFRIKKRTFLNNRIKKKTFLSKGIKKNQNKKKRKIKNRFIPSWFFFLAGGIQNGFQKIIKRRKKERKKEIFPYLFILAERARERKIGKRENGTQERSRLRGACLWPPARIRVRVRVWRRNGLGIGIRARIRLCVSVRARIGIGSCIDRFPCYRFRLFAAVRVPVSPVCGAHPKGQVQRSLAFPLPASRAPRSRRALRLRKLRHWR
jgi:hypothetical protein